jgi:phosphoglucosamine mutase
MEKMRANGYVLGGEQAGHIILLHPGFTSGCGIYAGMLVAALAADAKRTGSSLSTLAANIPRYPQVIANAHLHHKIELKTVAGLDDAITAALNAFDQKGRVNIRFSGTEPNLLRAMVEGGPTSDMGDVVARAIGLCRLVADATHTENPVIDVIDCVTGAPVQLT